MAIECATIDWQNDHQGNKVPVCRRFGDVYFSKSSGLEESRYVFIEQNHLSERFASIMQHGGVFVIGETGFGTGLNFLAVCALWHTLSKTYPNHNARLQFISTERYPLSPNDIQQALSCWQQTPLLHKYASQLIANYPLAVAGCHRRRFGSVILDLWFGDATQTLTELGAYSTNKVDAWFLDGFAPKKNAELWSGALFCAIKQLSKASTTLATFSAAGEVKRQLIAIGAHPKKVKGFGNKREMLTATFDTYIPHPVAPTVKTALVLGAGIAGLSTAYALARRGVTVTLIDKERPLAGSSGNPCALLAPKLYANADNKNQLSLMSFLYSHAFYRGLEDVADQPIFCQTGVIDALQPSKKPAAIIVAHPSALIQPLNDTPIPINKSRFWAWLPLAGQIIPTRFAKLVLAHPHIHFVQADIQRITQSERLAYACGDEQCFFADRLVVCAGVDSYAIDSKALGHTIYKTRHIRGQVSFCHINTPSDPWAVKAEGYACLFADQNKKTLLFGASFIRDTNDTTASVAEHQDNLIKLASTIEKDALALSDTFYERASIRSQTPDYHPMVGAISDKVWLHTALGSKGFGFAPFCAEIIASALLSELPCATTLLDKLAPTRPRLQTLL